MPGKHLVLKPNPPHFTIIAISDDLLAIIGQDRQKVLGKDAFEVFPENPEAVTATGPRNFRKSLHRALLEKKLDQAPVGRYDIRNAEGKFEVRYWSSSCKPVLDAAGNVSYILHTTTDVTELVLARKSEEAVKIMKTAYSLFMQAPVGISIVTGPENIVELANEELYKVLGINKEIIGKPLFLSLPELKALGIAEVLDYVRKTGLPYHAKDLEFYSRASGKEELRYFDIVYQPYYEQASDKEPIGVFCITHDVTEKVISRKKIEESEQQVRSVIESLYHPLGVYMGPEMRIQFANQGLKDGLGKGNDIIGKLYRELLPELEDQEIFEHLERVYKTGIPFNSKNHRIDLVVNGKLKPNYFDFSFTPLFDTEGKVYGVVNSGSDVTDMILAQKQIEESTRELNNLANSMPQIVWIANSKGEVYFYNDRVSEFAGARKLEDNTWSWSGLLYPEDEQPTTEAWNKAIREGSVYEKAHRLQLKDGSYRWHLSRAFPQRDEEGNIIKWFGTATDVHEEKVSQERLQAILDATPECIKIVDDAGTLQYMNPSGLEMVEGTADLLGNACVYEVIAPEYRSRWIKNHKRVCRGESLSWEFDIIGLNGTRRRIETHAVPLPGANGLAQLAVSRDITERKKTEEALELKNTQLTRINNDLDNFIYTASHDLKAPISNIEGLLTILHEELNTNGAPGAVALQIMLLMQQSVDRFKDTIHSLTDVVKLQHASTAEAVQVSLSEVIEEVSLDLEPLIKSSGAKMEIDITACPFIKFSKKNMRSVVYNLLSNALKYRSPERKLQIRINCHSITDFHVLTVSDNGLGFDSSRTADLFTMFKRFHDHVEGTGIGLYMVKKIVDNAGGHIEVESQLNQGTTFRIYFKR